MHIQEYFINSIHFKKYFKLKFEKVSDIYTILSAKLIKIFWAYFQVNQLHEK
jgi:hypothetical protein